MPSHLHFLLHFVVAAIIFNMVRPRRTNTKQCNDEMNNNPQNIVTIENHNAIISPNSKKEISLSDFNENILFEILIRFPAPSLHLLKRVCKKWLHIISDPHFIHPHLDRVRFEPNLIKRFMISDGCTPSLDIKDSEIRMENLAIGCKGEISVSCSGLILVENELSIHVSNPATKQLLMLPTCSTFGRRNLNDAEFREHDFFRLGYAPSTRECKVLHFFYHRKERQQHCEILTLGSNAWRRVDGRFRDLPLKINEQVLLNGVLHWVVGYNYIMSMNVAEETFDETPVPSCAAPPYHESFLYQPLYLMEIGGCPSLIHRISFVQFDVWILKDFRRKEWMRLYSIDGAEVGGTLFPIASLRNDEVIFQCQERKSGRLVLAIYNLRLGKMVEVRIYPGVILYWPSLTHFQSLVSWEIQSQSS